MFKENEQCSLNTSLWMFQSCLVTLWRKSIGRFRKFKAQFIGKCNQFVVLINFNFETWALSCFSLRAIMSTQDMFCNFPNPFHTQSWSLKVPSSTFENFNTNKNSFLSHSFVVQILYKRILLQVPGWSRQDASNCSDFYRLLKLYRGSFIGHLHMKKTLLGWPKFGWLPYIRHSPFLPTCQICLHCTAWDDF